MSLRPSRLALAAAAFLWLAGSAGAAVVPVDKTPYLDRPARLTLLEMNEPPGTDRVAVVVVNFEGQSLKGEGDRLEPAGERRGTLRSFLGGLQEPWRFNLHRVEDGAGQLRGYLLCFEDLEEGATLFEEENLILISEPGGLGGGASGGGGGGGY